MPAAPPQAKARPSLAQVRRWPPTVPVPTAAPALGMSRRSMYEAISTGRCPVRVITVNGRLKVLTASLVAVLEGKDPAPGQLR